MESRDEFTGARSRHKYKPESEIIKVENMIPEIISKEDWNNVQIILNSRKMPILIVLKKNTCFPVRFNAVNVEGAMSASEQPIAEEMCIYPIYVVENEILTINAKSLCKS